MPSWVLFLFQLMMTDKSGKSLLMGRWTHFFKGCLNVLLAERNDACSGFSVPCDTSFPVESALWVVVLHCRKTRSPMIFACTVAIYLLDASMIVAFDSINDGGQEREGLWWIFFINDCIVVWAVEGNRDVYAELSTKTKAILLDSTQLLFFVVFLLVAFVSAVSIQFMI